MPMETISIYQYLKNAYIELKLGTNTVTCYPATAKATKRPSLLPKTDSVTHIKMQSINFVEESKTLLDLQPLVEIYYILKSIIEMENSFLFEKIFNKATEWWDETAKILDCFISLYRVFIIYI